MRAWDVLTFTITVLSRQRFRALMLLLAIGVGVCSVIALTALGEGARGYVLEQFSFLGTDTLVILPGRQETTGGMPPLTGAATRDITLADAEAIRDFVPGVRRVAPIVLGAAEIRYQSRARETIVMGTTADFLRIRQLQRATGSNLPDADFDQAQPFAVVGGKVQRELFGGRSAVGHWLRIGNRRFRVIGVLSGRGDSFGLDLSDAVLVPVASAQQLFNRHGMFRVLVGVHPGRNRQAAQRQIEQLMQSRHQGERDVTIVSPDAILAGFSQIMGSLTVLVASIAAISLLVAGIMTMNIMLISVRSRTEEIGLLMALGASPGQVRMLFLIEAGSMAAAGACAGVVAGFILVAVGRALYPEVPFQVPVRVVLAGVGTAVMTALFFAWIPARQAAALPPVTALLKGH